MTAALVPGRVVELVPGVRRLVAPNPGMLTGPGTNSWLLGEREITVIDPGPAIDTHVEALLAAAAGRLRRVLVTHTHTDHSPAAALLAERTGAELVGQPSPAGRHQDPSFSPARVPADGDRLASAESPLAVLHTPGHASNHLCYLHQGLQWLFTGDHIIDGSTVVIDPPDGDMSAYLASLARLRELDLRAIAPGHGHLIREPRAAIERLIAHRLAREARVLTAVRTHPGSTPAALVPPAYEGVDPGLFRLAERSLLAHLEKFERDGRVGRRAGRWWPA